jgi:hypothetical protein
LPIISIYFLGHTLEHTKAPVIRVNRVYTDAATGEQICEKEEFIESLTHDSIIIQIPYLKDKRRTELEQLLALFDQSNATYDRHLLEINEDNFPERYRTLIRRLQKAIADPIVRETMEAEDDLIEEFKDYQRLITEKEQVITEKEQVITEKEQVITEKEQVITEKNKVLEERSQQLSIALQALYQSGMSIDQIADMFQLSVKEIERLLRKK